MAKVNQCIAKKRRVFRFSPTPSPFFVPVMNTLFDLGSYSIYVGDLNGMFPDWLRERDYSQVFILTDENTRRDCLIPFLSASDLPASVVVAGIPTGEQHKTLSTCERVWQSMLETRLDRRALVINLGGGVVGDLGGFCAATWKRGVDFVQIPTTLLAMTDAAIGGKLGIDFQGVKNTVGVFQNPAAVFADPRFLRTLPERELRSGLAEVLKHGFIGEPLLTEILADRRVVSDLLDGKEPDTLHRWLDLLCASIAVKARIVVEDPQERGLRMLLNYGHTIGHAVESYFLQTPFPLLHGEAVAMGMICESWLARTTAPGGRDQLARVIGAVAETFLHRPVPESAFGDIWAAMQQDKKNTAMGVRSAVPTGKPFEMQLLELTEEAVLDSLRFYNDLE